jgi:two-component system KDP operon response regulator KdpE
MLRIMLTAQGYNVSETADGLSTLQAAVNLVTSDVILLDPNLPDIDGLEIIKELRAKGASLPVIVLSNRRDETAKVTALDMGADDYITKPFGARELMARIRTSIRHGMLAEQGRRVFKSGDLTVDFLSRRVSLANKEVKLSPKEYVLLEYLINNTGKAVTHAQILKEVWNIEMDPQYVRIYIRLLRQKLREAPGNPRYILTEQGVGYRFCAGQ